MKINFIKILLICILFNCIATDVLFAQALIHVYDRECYIVIHLRKEFYQKSPQGIQDIINDFTRRRGEQQKILDTGWLGNLFRSNATIQARRNRAQDAINTYNSFINGLQAILNNYVPLTDAQIQALVNRWKNEIERKWNVPNYRFACCRVKVIVETSIRRENDPPREGFDQIGIVPGNFRSYIDGFKTDFNANGFSNDPYDHNMTGLFSSNTRVDYTAPHEAGHEMGLKDQYNYTTLNALPNHENDIMDGQSSYTDAQLAALSAVSVSNGIRTDNLATILNERNVICPLNCCPRQAPYRPPQRPQVAIDIIRRGPVADTSKPCDAHPPAAEPTSGIPPDEVSKPLEQPEDTQISQPQDQIAKLPEGIQYKSVDVDRTTVDTGIHYQDTEGGGMNIDTSTLATGRGTDFRKWKVTDATLVVDGENIRPSGKENFYVPKESAFRKTATTVFIALGSQYKGYTDKAQSGEVCPVTGKPKTDTESRGHTEEAIDRAGMALGLGLLLSQAKGEITGQKCHFRLNKEQAQKVKEGKGVLKIGMENIDTRFRKQAEVPLGKVSY